MLGRIGKSRGMIFINAGQRIDNECVGQWESMDGVASHHGTLARFHAHSDRPLLSYLRIRNGAIRRPLALIHPCRHLPPKLKYKAQAGTMMHRGRSPGALANCTRTKATEVVGI